MIPQAQREKQAERHLRTTLRNPSAATPEPYRRGLCDRRWQADHPFPRLSSRRRRYGNLRSRGRCPEDERRDRSVQGVGIRGRHDGADRHRRLRKSNEPQTVPSRPPRSALASGPPVTTPVAEATTVRESASASTETPLWARHMPSETTCSDNASQTSRSRRGNCEVEVQIEGLQWNVANSFVDLDLTRKEKALALPKRGVQLLC